MNEFNWSVFSIASLWADLWLLLAAVIIVIAVVAGDSMKFWTFIKVIFKGKNASFKIKK